MRLDAYAAGSVGHEVDLVSFANGLNDWKRETDLRPERRHDDLLPARLAYPRDDALVLPCIDKCPVNRLLLRENVLQLLDEEAALPLDHRGQERWHTERLRGLGAPHDIVDDRLGVMAAEAGKLKRLVVDQDKRAVRWSAKRCQAGLRSAARCTVHCTLLCIGYRAE